MDSAAELQAMRRRRLMTSIAVMSATVMQVIDTTIVNVALPQMQGQLNATPDQISWVLTSYLVASGIVMLLTGYFSDRIGQKRFLLLSIIGFTVSSLLCGISGSLSEIVSFRLLQGIFGAALVPLSQSIMVQIFPPEERGKAMAIWGVGVMVGPILGPTLGGWLTEALNWRWTFFINLPIGILSASLVWRSVSDTEIKKRDMDWLGLVLLAMGIGALQFILDRGNQDDWFEALSIQYATLVSVAGFLGFVWHGLTKHEHIIFDPAIFRDRNFTTASLLLAVFGLGLFGTLMLQPLMLENLLGYSAFDTGLMLAPRGIASMISMMLVGRLISRTDPRLLIILGMGVFSFGSWLTTLYSLNVTTAWIVLPAVIQGMGLGLVFVPLSTVAFSTLPPRLAADAAGIYSVMRTIGSSIGISIIATMMTNHAQVAWHNLDSNINRFNPAVNDYLRGLHMNSDSVAAPYILAQELGRQSSMLGMLDAFELVTWSFALMLPLVFFMRYQKPQPRELKEAG
ncbi:MAG: DHA2 family efflux MFS transporter permease subunit [Chromatiales bacterium]|nr:DHA2 family efflux MFS transporter permease subunit [Chromatiales bacterium]